MLFCLHALVVSCILFKKKSKSKRKGTAFGKQLGTITADEQRLGTISILNCNRKGHCNVIEFWPFPTFLKSERALQQLFSKWHCNPTSTEIFTQRGTTTCRNRKANRRALHVEKLGHYNGRRTAIGHYKKLNLNKKGHFNIIEFWRFPTL